MSLEVVPSIQLLVLHRVDTAQNMHRYYVLSVAPTLFEDTALVREWGRIGKSTRRVIELHADKAAARESLQTWLRRKGRRGYVVAHQA